MFKKFTLIKPLVFTQRTSKAGTKYSAADAQGVAYFEDGTVEVTAWLMMAPRDGKGQDLPAGDYVPVWTGKIDTRDRRPVMEITGFKAVTAAVSPVSKAA